MTGVTGRKLFVLSNVQVWKVNSHDGVERALGNDGVGPSMIKLVHFVKLFVSMTWQLNHVGIRHVVTVVFGKVLDPRNQSLP